MSEGEIPLILDTCPIVAGLIFSNFSFASLEIEEVFKFEILGILCFQV